MTIGLYWCSTDNGDSDFWVVADSASEARDFFAVVHGFSYSLVNAKRVKTIPPEDIVRLDLCIPCDPTKEQLAAWNVQYNSNFHVFSFRGKIYRPESMVRHMLITHAKRAHSARRRGRLRRNASLQLVGPSSTSKT